MVLDPIPQSLHVHFFGSRPQPPTSHSLSIHNTYDLSLMHGTQMMFVFVNQSSWIGNDSFVYTISLRYMGVSLTHSRTRTSRESLSRAKSEREKERENERDRDRDRCMNIYICIYRERGGISEKKSVNHMCDMTHSYVWCPSFTCVTWLIHTCDMLHNESITCVPWLMHRCAISRVKVWHDSFIRVMSLIRMCDMTHSYVWHATKHNSHVCHDVFIRETFWMHIHTHTHTYTHTHTWHTMTRLNHTCVWHDAFIRVARYKKNSSRVGRDLFIRVTYYDTNKSPLRHDWFRRMLQDALFRVNFWFVSCKFLICFV